MISPNESERVAESTTHDSAHAQAVAQQTTEKTAQTVHTNPTPAKNIRSIRSKLIRATLLGVSFVAVSAIGATVVMQVESSKENLVALEKRIHDDLEAKGSLVTGSHSIVLRGLVSDNAFSDVTNIVKDTVTKDQDIIYGTYQSTDGTAWTYVSPNTKNESDPKQISELKLPNANAPDKLTQRALKGAEAAIFAGESEVWEFAAPIKVDDEVMGTVRYGVSTKAMQDAVAVARAESEAALYSLLATLVGSVLLSAAGAGLLARRQARTISEPIETITHAAKKLAEGDRTVHVDVHSGDEVEVLGGTFNQMVADLKASYESLEGLNKTLEQKVEARTAELAGRNREMRMVLDNVNQGFITLSPDAAMASERSAIVDTWLGTPEIGESFIDYLRKSSPKLADNFFCSWMQVEENFLPLEVTLDMLPKHAVVAGRSLDFGYLPFTDDAGGLQGVLVVISDGTERVARERAEREQKEVVEIFSRIMRDRTGFVSFISDTNQLVETVAAAANPAQQPHIDTAVLKRQFHTIKGNCAIYGLARVAECVHHIEDTLPEQEGFPTPEQIAELQELWTHNISTAKEFGVDAQKDTERHVDIPIHELRDLYAVLSKSAAQNAAQNAAQIVENWLLEPAQVPLGRLADQAKAVAQKLGKGDVDVYIESDVRLPPEQWNDLWNNLVHVVNNAIDHGLESPEERAQAGKSTAQISLYAYKQAQGFAVEIADNGRGIHWDRVRAKAQKQGLPASKHEDLVNALFTDGVSTKDEVSSVSGRGVGLAAVRQICTEAGGQIDIKSTQGEGTRFIFTFPAIFAQANDNLEKSENSFESETTQEILRKAV